MLLAVDAGNTNVVFALIDAGQVRARWRIATDPRRTADEYAVWLIQLLQIEGYERTTVTDVIIGTVVPRALHNLQVLSSKYFKTEAVIAGKGEAGWGFQLDVEEPEQLGADRALNCIAAHARHPGDLIIIDFGTATTFDVIDYRGAYKGGIIAPGINLSLDALVTAAAKLPRIAIEAPRSNSVIGLNTVDQMHIGIYWGYIAMIEGLVARLKLEVGRPAKVIATGGLAVLFEKQTQAVDTIEPDLTIQGLAMLWERAHSRASNPTYVRNAVTPGKELLFLALGGSGEIGMNVNLYGTQGKWLMVDCGITFGDANYPGVDVILPDLQFIEERLDELLGIVLTHGHEDHIGALPYLAADLNVPLYATPFTAGLIRGKLEEEGIEDRIKLNVVNDEEPFDLGPFSIRYVPLAHSIPEGNALLIETPYGSIFHTGDWKLDETPSLGGASTAAELTAIGDEGILTLVCDSTNVFNPEASGSEGEVRKGLDDVIGAAKGRVLVTTFASNAARLQTLGEVAEDTGRALCVAGRSLDRIIRVAKATGYLRDFPETIDFDTAMSLPPGRVMIVATGGQGEPRAALARIADGQHQLKLHEGDLVVFSSRQIPGNEIAIGRIMNQLAEKGCDIVTDRQAFVHVSGHPGRPELAEMYGWIRPQILLPVHGEVRHMHEQARFGRSQGIPTAITQVNGEIVRLAPGKPGKIGFAHAGRLVLDGDVILPADGATISERRRLALYGQISVAVAIKGGRLIGSPEIRIQGVPVEEDRDAFIEEATKAAADAVRADKGGGERLREALRLAVRRVATRYTGKKPVVDVLVVEG